MQEVRGLWERATGIEGVHVDVRQFYGDGKGQTLEQPYLDIAMMRREQQEWREGMKVRYKKFEETQFLIF